jgi:hypothetical protein
MFKLEHQKAQIPMFAFFCLNAESDLFFFNLKEYWLEWLYCLCYV